MNSLRYRRVSYGSTQAMALPRRHSWQTRFGPAIPLSSYKCQLLRLDRFYAFPIQMSSLSLGFFRRTDAYASFILNVASTLECSENNGGVWASVHVQRHARRVAQSSVSCGNDPHCTCVTNLASSRSSQVMIYLE